MDEIKKFHKQLVAEGNFQSARLLLRFMLNGCVFVPDGHDEAWSTGVADFLLICHACSNRKGGFIARLKGQA